MFVSLARYIKGYLKIRIVGYSPERFINACSYRRINIWNIQPVNGAYEIHMLASDFRKLKPVIKKTGSKIEVLEKNGLPFFFFRYRKRKLFFLGAALFFLIIGGLSRHTWSIDFVGNRKYTEETLLDFLNETGVHCGMRVNEIECSRIVKDIRKAYNDIVWVSASIDGCRLVVRIKENEMIHAEPQKLPEGDKDVDLEEGTDLIAPRDGTIRKIVTRTGIPLVKEGDAVKKGDILVTGAVPIKNDSGEVTSIRLQKSDADIELEYRVNYEHSIPVQREQKQYEQWKMGRCYIRVGDHLLWCGLRRNNTKNCEIFTSEKRLRIGSSFVLPVSVGVQTYTPYKSKQTRYTDLELQKKLSAAFSEFCSEEQKKGVEIIRNDVKIYKGDRQAEARGMLVARTVVFEETKTAITEEMIDGNDRNDD